MLPKNLCNLKFLSVFAVAKLAKDLISPLVKKMDDDHKFDPTIVEALFENGVRLLNFVLP